VITLVIQIQRKPGNGLSLFSAGDWPNFGNFTQERQGRKAKRSLRFFAPLREILTQTFAIN